MGKMIFHNLCYALLVCSMLVGAPFFMVAHDVNAEVGSKDLGERGKLLHDENCLTCHKPEKYYLREDRIKTWPKLILQVRKCQLDVGEEWTSEEFLDVLGYINNSYYKFNQ
jgi:hypothetical protein